MMPRLTPAQLFALQALAAANRPIDRRAMPQRGLRHVRSPTLAILKQYTFADTDFRGYWYATETGRVHLTRVEAHPT